MRQTFTQEADHRPLQVRLPAPEVISLVAAIRMARLPASQRLSLLQRHHQSNRHRPQALQNQITSHAILDHQAKRAMMMLL